MTLALPSDASLSTLLISRELHQLFIIDVLQLWAAQHTEYAAQGLVYHIGHAQRDIWLGLCGSLECEASGIVALEQSCSVENASCKIGDINTGESVSLAEITADVEELRLCQAQMLAVLLNGAINSAIRFTYV